MKHYEAHSKDFLLTFGFDAKDIEHAQKKINAYTRRHRYPKNTFTIKEVEQTKYGFPVRKTKSINNPARDGEVDQHAANDLYLTIESDSDLYRQQGLPILKNLATKKARGIYNHDLAIKLYMYLVENGAKKYAKDFGGVWHDIFNIPTRREVAKMFVDRFEAEYELGDYSNKTFLPKKYIKNPGTKERTPAKKFLDFSGRARVRKTVTNITIPKQLIYIGDAPEINYLSDKKDGVKRLYKHILKKHGKILASPNGEMIIITGLNLNIKKEGLTG